MGRIADRHAEQARALDASDALAGFRDRFFIPTGASSGREVTYLCGNSLGLQPRGVEEAVMAELRDWRRFGVLGHFEAGHPWYSYHEMFLEQGAAIVGARHGEAVLMNSLTVNLHLMLTSFFQPTATRFRILMEEPVFPSDRYAIRSHLDLHHLDASALRVVRAREGEQVIRTDDLLQVIADEGDSIALVMLSGVSYLTGEVLDMEAITRAARAKGCVVGFDLAHAVGNIPLSLHDWGVDFAVWCTYKYLNCGPGAVGGCFVHERHANRPELPRLQGWWGNDPATRFEMPEAFIPQPGAAGWQLSNAPVMSMATCGASLVLFAEAGFDRLRAKALALGDFLLGMLDELEAPGFEVITPRDPRARGCQLSLRFASGDLARRTSQALEQADIISDFRSPDIIRVAPVPLYNTFEDVRRLVAALEAS